MSASGHVDADAKLADWISRLPADFTRGLTLGLPGAPAGGGSDHSSFVCADEIKHNAVMTAMLVYLASEDPERVGRTKREMGTGTWPTCTKSVRTAAQSSR